MAAKYVLAFVAAVFYLFTALRIIRDGRLTAQTRTWLLVATIFTAVSAWLWWSQS